MSKLLTFEPYHESSFCVIAGIVHCFHLGKFSWRLHKYGGQKALYCSFSFTMSHVSRFRFASRHHGGIRVRLVLATACVPKPATCRCRVFSPCTGISKNEAIWVLRAQNEHTLWNSVQLTDQQKWTAKIHLWIRITTWKVSKIHLFPSS